MASLNVITLIGNLTEKPSLNYTQSGTARSNFTIAVNEYRGDEQETTFVPIVCWGNTAENAAEYLNKGNPVALSGRLRISNYEDDEGNNRKYTQVVANQVQFLSNGNGEQANTPNETTTKQTDDGDEEIPFDT